MPVVGWLNPQPLKSNRDRFAAFLKGLREAGFVEGKNVMIDLSPGGRASDCRSWRTISSGEGSR